MGGDKTRLGISRGDGREVIHVRIEATTAAGCGLQEKIAVNHQPPKTTHLGPNSNAPILINIEVFRQVDFHWDNNITYRTRTFSSIGYLLRTGYKSPILANAPLRTSAGGSRIGWFISSILQQQSYDTMCGNCASGVIPHSYSIVGVRPKVLASFESLSSRIA